MKAVTYRQTTLIFVLLVPEAMVATPRDVHHCLCSHVSDVILSRVRNVRGTATVPHVLNECQETVALVDTRSHQFRKLGNISKQKIIVRNTTTWAEKLPIDKTIMYGIIHAREQKKR